MWHKISLIDVILHWGVTHEQFKFVKQLVRFTPNLDPIDSWGKTPLMVAANQRNSNSENTVRSRCKNKSGQQQGKLVEDPFCFD